MLTKLVADSLWPIRFQISTHSKLRTYSAFFLLPMAHGTPPKCQSTLAQQFHKHTKNEEKKTCCTASATVHCAPKRKQRKENIIKRSIVSYKFDRLLRNIAIVDTRRTRPKEAVLAPTHARTPTKRCSHGYYILTEQIV